MKTRQVTLDEVGSAAVMLARAFHDDPVAQWVFPDRIDRVEKLPKLFLLQLTEVYLPAGRALAIGDLCVGLGIRSASVKDSPYLLHSLARIVGSQRLRVVAQGFELMRSLRPDEPHLYLYVIGTRPDSQHQGLGEKMLDELTKPDRSRVPVYFEVTRRALVGFFERMGYEDRGEIQLPDGPRVTRMLRRPDTLSA